MGLGASLSEPGGEKDIPPPLKPGELAPPCPPRSAAYVWISIRCSGGGGEVRDSYREV